MAEPTHAGGRLRRSGDRDDRFGAQGEQGDAPATGGTPCLDRAMHRDVTEEDLRKDLKEIERQEREVRPAEARGQAGAVLPFSRRR